HIYLFMSSTIKGNSMSIKATSINSAGNESIKQSRENYLNINHIICNSQMNGNSRAIRLLIETNTKGNLR
ncbi:hypothetical protein, partial [Citrobacter freundii]